MTEPELRRDFYEILKKDNNMVYIDYLRDLFHIIVLGENKKLTGEREQDFGQPIKLFEDHKKAIITQVENVSKVDDSDERKKIIKKYLELSRYHNGTIDMLRQVIEELVKNKSIIYELFNDQLISASSKDRGITYVPKFSAEDHPEQSDMLNILGTVVNRLIENHQNEDSTLEEAINTICNEAPEELKKLEQSLSKSKIAFDSLKV